jgi:hypothetical protein
MPKSQAVPYWGSYLSFCSILIELLLNFNLERKLKWHHLT